MASLMCEPLYAILYSAFALVLLLPVGNGLCSWLLRVTKLQAAMEARRALAEKNTPAAAPSTGLSALPRVPEPRVGVLIGSLERCLLAFGILVGSWEILAAIVALKTVARFKELDEKLDAEYFLVGSLFSLAWGVAVTATWIAYDRHYGANLSAMIAQVAHAIKGKD
ncbi:MAG TPA: hypothetical protein VG248_03080 [Caulobacteraceae bacterium]|jgi:hypothetical protein|nr:hypothetical protein [Caulobacteraceae bacterium]